jgi:hypothetical protein
MSELDYYTIMESRIKFLAQKYDPNNKFPVEWEKKRDEEEPAVEDQPLRTRRVKKRAEEVIGSFIAFLF